MFVFKYAACGFALIFINIFACTMHSTDPLPRHQSLKTFDPHRTEFICKYESDSVPATDAEAEEWNKQALYLTRYDIWPEQRDWKAAEQLWIKAAARNHWKAMINLAALYEKNHGEGSFLVSANPYKSVEIAENAMVLGIAAGFEKMGYYHWRGTGGIVKDSSRAWAFWQIAADMGNPTALTRIGKATSAIYDNPEDGFWGNRAIAMQMLQCAVSQGSGEAAYELGADLDGPNRDLGEDYIRSVHLLHDGVKLGSEDAAGWLFSSFERGTPLVGNIIDIERSERYRLIGEALYHNPDLRLPNLDKVIPLPPAKLPIWDGKMESLVEAAKPVKAVNDRPVSDASQRRGRAFMADSLKLDPDNIVWHTSEGFQDARLPEAFLARHTATYSGYWKPRCRNHYLDRDFDERPWPEYYARGESFEESGVPRHDDPANYWRYLGVGIPRPHSEPFSPAAENLVRHISRPGDATSPWCHAGKACPTTGVWFPSAIEGHPDAKIIDPYRHQRFITAGATMPDATVWGLPTAGGIVWRLLEIG